MLVIPAVAPTRPGDRKRSVAATCRRRPRANARRARRTVAANTVTRRSVCTALKWITTTTQARSAHGLVALAIAGSMIAWDLSASRAFIRSRSALPDDAKPEPIPFTVDVTVDRTRVQVTLLLRPGTAVTVAETKTTTEPTPKDHDG
jgi:hypothetical protein